MSILYFEHTNKSDRFSLISRIGQLSTQNLFFAQPQLKLREFKYQSFAKTVLASILLNQKGNCLNPLQSNHSDIKFQQDEQKMI